MTEAVHLLYVFKGLILTLKTILIINLFDLIMISPYSSGSSNIGS